ncbi:kinase-like protein [Ceratobasidium sp. AG-I]|nr:kinase-like protein [Ceratobasidium sp. AG-I]
MEECTHDLSNTPLTVFSSCQFQKISAIITLGGRADVVCGFIDAIDPPKQVAVKGFRPAGANEQNAIENELTTWRILSPHPNIALFLGTAPINQFRSLYLPIGPVSDYYEHGNLNQFLGKTDPKLIDHPKRLRLLVGVVHGLTHIHSKSIAHGDLKGTNVVVDACGEVAKICDFGSSVINCSCDAGPKDREGSVLWDSPELWQEDDGIRTRQSDIWALGCVMLEVHMGMSPWAPDYDIERAMARQMRGGYPARREWLNLDEHPILPELWEIMTNCWQEEPSDRPSARELLSRLELLSQNPLVFSSLGVGMLPS